MFVYSARGKKVICYNCRGEGHVARQCKEPKRKMDSQYFKDKALLMEAKEKGDKLDLKRSILAELGMKAPMLSELSWPPCHHQCNQQSSPNEEMHQEDTLDSDAEIEIDDIHPVSSVSS
ncbi:retrovirus-related pol polyprotein from transposon TNT 1-94 [Tanacetum coccineum]